MKAADRARSYDTAARARDELAVVRRRQERRERQIRSESHK
jgi:hypothetical protein